MGERDEENTMKSSYDCIVMGGGPAGSTAAAILAEAGSSTLLLEREAMPRFHVGESLMPETYWIFQRLGLLEAMNNSSFVKKVSVQFVAPSGKQSLPFFFKEHDPRPCSQTWQVERAPFDKMLFDNAAAKGADCHDNTRVMEVLLDGDQAKAVRVRTADGKLREIAGRVIVDATGQHSFLAHRLGLRVDNPRLKKASIWSYYRGARRDEGENGGATIILHAKHRKAWFWFIPLADDITSIGVVADNDYLLKGRGSTEEIFQEELTHCSAMQERLQNAERIDPFRAVKEFSYTTTRSVGDGWVLIGDAWGFVDPVYSAGVYLAMKTGELAADSIIEGLANNDTSSEQLGKWIKGCDEGVSRIRKLIDVFYSEKFSFGRFMKEYPQHQGNLTDLLIGRVFHESAGAIFEDMQVEGADVKEISSSLKGFDRDGQIMVDLETNTKKEGAP